MAVRRGTFGLRSIGTLLVTARTVVIAVVLVSPLIVTVVLVSSLPIVVRTLLVGTVAAISLIVVRAVFLRCSILFCRLFEVGGMAVLICSRDGARAYARAFAFLFVAVHDSFLVLLIFCVIEV